MLEKQKKWRTTKILFTFKFDSFQGGMNFLEMFLDFLHTKTII